MGKIITLIAVTAVGIFLLFWFLANSGDIIKGEGKNWQVFTWRFVIIPIITTVIGAGVAYFSSGIRDNFVGKKKKEQFEKGSDLYKKEKYSEAIQVWLPLADMSYGKKNWISKKIIIIAATIKKSLRGYAPAQFKLGEMYEYGIGVVQDYEKARYWYEKGVSQGHADSQTSLGYLYRHGLGVKQDYKKALELYKKSAKQGNVSGQNNLAFMHEKGYGGINVNYKKALDGYKKAADQAYASAQNNIGFMHAKGLGIKKDEMEAVRWYRQAAKQGNGVGQYNLARMYQEGEGIKQDYMQAYKWFYIADKNGDEEAKDRLNKLAEMMTNDEVAEAIKLAEKCKKSKYKDCGDPPEYDA